MLRELREGLASGTLYLVVFLGLLTLEVTGLLELHFEEDAVGANITTGGDALWWGYATATTVGYGDQFPVTMGGRIVGVVMLTVGVALFATFSGFLANAFLSSARHRSLRRPKRAATSERRSSSSRACRSNNSVPSRRCARGSSSSSRLRETDCGRQ